jgi:hypothetical protein
MTEHLEWAFTEGPNAIARRAILAELASEQNPNGAAEQAHAAILAQAVSIGMAA